MLQMDRVQSKKMFQDQTKVMLQRRDPAPGPVLLLISIDMLRPSTYDEAVCVNAAVEINVLNYNVAVCQRTVPRLKEAKGHALASTL